MIKVTGMQIKKGKPNKGGSRIMAHFDFHARDLGMKGCVLSLNAEGKWRVWTPLIDPNISTKMRKVQQVCVYWRSGGEMEQQVLDAALELYYQLSDDDGDVPAPYVPRQYPEPTTGPDDASGLWRTLRAEDEACERAGL